MTFLGTEAPFITWAHHGDAPNHFSGPWEPLLSAEEVHERNDSWPAKPSHSRLLSRLCNIFRFSHFPFKSENIENDSEGNSQRFSPPPY